MKRILTRSLELVLAAVALLYFVDWAVLRMKDARGAGYGTVQVEQYLSTPLKGNKMEYDYMGTRSQPCTRAIFPHGATPCWWLARHSSRWE